MSKTELKNSNTFTEEQMKQIKEILAGTGYEISQEACSPSTDSSTCPDDDKPLAIDPATGKPPAKDDKPSLAEEAEKATK